MAIHSSGANLCTSANSDRITSTCIQSYVRPVPLLSRFSEPTSTPSISTYHTTNHHNFTDLWNPPYISLLTSDLVVHSPTTAPNKSVATTTFCPVVLSVSTSDPVSSVCDHSMENTASNNLADAYGLSNSIIATINSCPSRPFVGAVSSDGIFSMHSLPQSLPNSSVNHQSVTSASVSSSSTLPNTVMTTGCSLLFGSSVMDVPTSAAVSSTIPVASSPSACFLINAESAPSSRLLLQRSTTGALLQTTRPLSTSESSLLNLNPAIASSTGSGVLLSGSSQSSINSPMTSKLVNLASPISAGVRLLASTNNKITASPSLLHSHPSTMVPQNVNPGKSATVVTLQCGITLSNKSHVVNSANTAPPLQQTQALLVKSSPDVSVSKQPDHPASTVPSLSVGPAQIYATPTVLAFSLTSAIPPATVSSSGFIAQVGTANKSAPTPVLIRANYNLPSCSTSLALSQGVTTPNVSPASLLKPFSLAVTTGNNVSSTSVTPTIPLSHVIPVTITSAKISPNSPTLARQAIQISPGHLSASLVAQANRRRARKQQLATASSDSNIVGATTCSPEVVTHLPCISSAYTVPQITLTPYSTPSNSPPKPVVDNKILDSGSCDTVPGSGILGIRLLPLCPAPTHSISSSDASTHAASTAASGSHVLVPQTSAIYVLACSSYPAGTSFAPRIAVGHTALSTCTSTIPSTCISTGDSTQRRLRNSSDPIDDRSSPKAPIIHVDSGQEHHPVKSSIPSLDTSTVNSFKTTSEVSVSKPSCPSGNSLLLSLPTRSPSIDTFESTEYRYEANKISGEPSATLMDLGSHGDKTMIFRRIRKPSTMVNSRSANTCTADLAPSHTPVKRARVCEETFIPARDEPSCSEAPLTTHVSSDLNRLSQFPNRPSIIPRSFNLYRSGSGCRLKSSHFLSLADIRQKPTSRFDRPTGSRRVDQPSTSLVARSERSLLNARRHRRRLAIQRSNDRTDASNAGFTGQQVLSAAERRLLHDLASIIAKQKEMQFVNSPLTNTSVLSPSGWRALSCVANLDLLLASEKQTLQTFNSLLPCLNGLRHTDSSVQSSHTGHSETSEFRKYADVLPPRPGTPERLSTASVLSSMSAMLQVAGDVDEETGRELDRARELIQNITDRKRHLLHSIDQLRTLTTDVLEHFRVAVARHLGEFEQHFASSHSRSMVRPTASRDDATPIKRAGRNSEPRALPKPKSDRRSSSLCNGVSSSYQSSAPHELP